MVLTPFMVQDNVQVWHKSTIAFYAGMLHLGLLQSLRYSYMSQIYSGLSKGHDSQPLQKGQNDTDRVVSSS